MTAILNYILEANLALLILLGIYLAFLRKETNFVWMRFFLLASVVSSLAFPLFEIVAAPVSAPLSISRVIPLYWLPEVAINAESAVAEETAIDFWKYAAVIYVGGLGIFFGIMLLQLVRLRQVLRHSVAYRSQGLRIAESTDNKPTFSFFNFIFIGKAHELTDREKEQIIRHESVHARQWHSLDIMLINILKIFFWFNPFLNIYKKTFIQLHEFEADARAVENSDVNKYCSLLARVALQSADFKLANHFNNSLTVKRIEMMRTIKHNIRKWKVAAVAASLPLVFCFVACQDQVMDDLTEIAQNSTHALIVPAHIQSRFDQLKKENPEKQYVLLELNDKASGKLDELNQKYGLPKAMEVFKTVDGQPQDGPVRGEAGNIFVEKSRTPDPGLMQEKGEQTFAIIEYNDQSSQISEAAAQEEEVYTVVEEAPEFPGGWDAMREFIKSNLQYPLAARQQGIEGTVYISFVVEKDGSSTSPKIIKGLSADCDAEVERVLGLFPKWKPGKQSGKVVRVKFVLPIKFGM